MLKQFSIHYHTTEYKGAAKDIVLDLADDDPTFARVVPGFGSAVLLEVLRAKQRVFRIELGEGNLFPSAMYEACQKGL